MKPTIHSRLININKIIFFNYKTLMKTVDKDTKGKISYVHGSEEQILP